jgi:hypothetical protein
MPAYVAVAVTVGVVVWVDIGRGIGVDNIFPQLARKILNTSVNVNRIIYPLLMFACYLKENA